MPSIFIRLDKYDQLINALEKALDELDRAESFVQQLEDAHEQEAQELERMKHDLQTAREKSKSLLESLKQIE